MSKKRITLVRPAFSNVYGVYGKLPKYHEIRPPLGLLYVASSLEKAGHEVKIIDAEVLLLSPEQLYTEIVKTETDFVGFTSTTPEFHIVASICQKLKASHPDIKIIVGGAHVTALPKETIEENPAINYVVCGEGERAAVKIVEEVPEERIIRDNDIENLDELPEPARHLLNYDYYKYAMPGIGMIKMDVIESSRGCPFLCTFCFNRARKPRYRNPVLVVDEIERSYKKHRIQAMMFFDDTLTVNKKHIMDICDEIIRRGLNKHILFYANTRANTTDKEMLIRMKDAGVAEISMGVESGNPEILEQTKKGTTHEQYKRVYKWMYELNFQTRASFIVGLPYETHQTVRDTISFAKNLDLMRANCNILTPYPGTEIYEQVLEGKGIHLLCKDWKEFKRWGTSVIRTDKLTKEDLEYYQKRFITEFYTQPKVLFYHFKQIFKGNFSYFYYRPLIFAIKRRIKEDVLGIVIFSLQNIWNNYIKKYLKIK
jgi:anaerobic magnesium-protoporphyrin IX monomethyl ester cyclase